LTRKIFSFALLLTALLLATACRRGDDDVLIIFTWEDYVPAAVIAEFELRTGVRVIYASFSSNEEMFAAFEHRRDQFDIILCSDYMIYRMIDIGGMLHRLDHTRIPNMANICVMYTGLYFDPYNLYSIPYSTGSPLIVYNSALVDSIVSLRCLWREDLRGKVVLLDDIRDIMGMTLLMLGECVNTTDPAVLERVRVELLSLKPNIIAFNSDFPHRSIISGDAAVGFMYGSQITAAMNAVPTVRFVFPEEGVSTFVDSFVVSAQAPNLDNAYLFLNFILEAEISAQASSIINYGNTNQAATTHLPERFINNLSVNIPPHIRQNAQYFRPLGAEAEQLWDRVWTEFRAR